PDLPVIHLASCIGACAVEVANPLIYSFPDNPPCLAFLPVSPQDPFTAQSCDGNFNAGLSKYSGGDDTDWQGGVLTHRKLLLSYVNEAGQDSKPLEALLRASE